MRLSVIIPIYNKEKTIRRAAESVLKQGLTSDEYELLLIDDGSSDQSAAICQQLAEEHPDVVKLITKQNEGVGPTRNLGISMSTGEYICFVDADDYLKDGGFRDYMDHFFDNKFDMLSYYSTTIKEGKDDIALAKNIHGEIRYETTGHEMLGKGECPTFIWNSWYRKSFLQINNLKFEPFSYGEDLLFCINLMHANPRIRQTTSFIYVYITYESGMQLSKTRDGEKTTANVLNFVKVYERMGEITKDMKKKNIPCDMTKIFDNSLGTFTSRLLSSNITVTQLRKIKTLLRRTGLLNGSTISKSAKLSRYIISSDLLFPVLKYMYKKVFIPFILPKIDRETGRIG